MSNSSAKSERPENEGRRYFTPSERKVIARADGYRCAYCGTVAMTGEADHVDSYTNGGETDLGNAAWSCPSCNRAKGGQSHKFDRVGPAKPVLDTTRLRGWQKEAIAKFKASNQSSFFIAAGVGSGKTFAALAAYLDGDYDLIVVMMPKDGIVTSWVSDAKKLNLNLAHIDDSARFDPMQPPTGAHGYVLTNGMAASTVMDIRILCQRYKVLAVIDEAHHCHENGKWGRDAEQAFAKASRIIAMSGTPFRADDNRIAELGYESEASTLKGVPDYSYSYGEAFRETIVAGVVCRLMGGEIHRYNVEDGDEFFNFDDKYPDTAEGLKACNARLRAAAVHSLDWQMAGIAEARKDLMTFRRNGYPWAGLVVCSTVAQATEIEKRITETYGDKCMLIVKDAKTSAAVKEFIEDPSYVWAISITKISEGVSINRLRVGVLLSHVTSRSFFEQIRGRVARLVDGFSQAEQFSLFFVPEDPRLKKYAEESNDIVAHIINLDTSLNGGADDEDDGGKRKSGRAEKGDLETPEDTPEQVENLKGVVDASKDSVNLGKFTLFARHKMTGAVYDEEFFDEAKYLELRARLLAAGVPSHLASRMSEAEREGFLKIVEG